jgi:malate dehydrogenase (oxaloacetate-decarboxylating)(NADP+)
MLDRQGVIHSGRTDLNQYKQRFANDTPCAP